MLFWLILLLLALSLVGKKNYYYAAVVPRHSAHDGGRAEPVQVRQARRRLAVATLAVGWAQYSARSPPTSTFPESPSRVNWTGAVGPQAPLRDRPPQPRPRTVSAPPRHLADARRDHHGLLRLP